MRFDAVPLQGRVSVVAGILAGFAVLLGVEVPTSRILAANLALYPLVPWAPLLAALFLYLAWQYLNGRGWPPESSAARQRMLRSRTLPPTVWLWSLISGGLGLVTWGALALLIADLGRLGPVRPSDCSQVPAWTMACVIFMRTVEEGVFQEAAFRGYIQTTLEECCRPATAILLTAALFSAVQFLRDPSVAIWLISFVARSDPEPHCLFDRFNSSWNGSACSREVSLRDQLAAGGHAFVSGITTIHVRHFRGRNRFGGNHNRIVPPAGHHRVRSCGRVSRLMANNLAALTATMLLRPQTALVDPSPSS